MLSTNYNYQYIDLSHEPIEGQPFEHIVNLVTHLFRPTITIGISDYFNIGYSQTIGVRSMDWMGEEDSDHHQDGIHKSKMPGVRCQRRPLACTRNTPCRRTRRPLCKGCPT